MKHYIVSPETPTLQLTITFYEFAVTFTIKKSGYRKLARYRSPVLILITVLLSVEYSVHIN